MKIIFNELGVITSIDTTDEPIRQGNVGVNNLFVDFSNMNGVNNLDYACVFTYVRPDKSKINDVIMLSSAENTKYFEFNFSNKWFFELYGDASITVKLLKDNTVLANGEFNIVIEKTSADNDPQITYDEYLHLVESIAKTQQDAKQYTDDSVQALKDAVAENYAEKTYVDNQLNLCVKLTDIDTDFSLTSTNPLQNKVVSKQIKDINYTIMTIKEELFETILSEIDYKVDYATIYPIPETLSDNDGTHRVVYSDTQLKEVEGNSVAFNQLVKIYTSSQSKTLNGIELIDNRDGSYIINGTSTADTYLQLGDILPIVIGHKYLIKGGNGGSSSTYYLTQNSSSGANDYGNGVIYTQPNNNYGRFMVVVIKSGITINNLTFRPQLFDISLFPLDISSVEEFNRIFPLTYYPYNAGEIKNTVIKGVKVNGYNAFDGELEIGYWSNDTFITNVPSHDGVGSKNYIKVIGGQKYTLEYNNANIPFSSVWTLNQYDADKNLIKSGSVNKDTVLENNCCYVRFNQWASGQTDLRPYLSSLKVCFHITGSRTGYAPYKEPRIIQIPQTELKSAGSVHNTIKFVEGNIIAGQQRYNMVQVSRVGSVDLGTLNWAYVNDVSCFRATTDISDIKQVSANNVIFNGICSKYKTTDYKTTTINNIKSISLQANEKRVWIHDGDLGTDATTFKQAMSGVMLNYEKNEYTETTLATDLTFEEVSAIIEQGGSIETVFEIVPPNLKTAFVVNKAIVS